MAATTKSEPITRMALVDEPTRPRAEIQADLDRARAEIRELRRQCEADERKRTLMEEAIARAMKDWEKFHIGMPFDPHAYNPPMVPHQLDAELHKRHHRLHYLIAKLETEMEAADKAE